MWKISLQTTGSPSSLYEPHKEHNMVSNYRGLYGIFYKISMKAVKGKIFNKNGLPYSIRVLLAPGVVISPIKFDLSDFLESWFSLHEEETRRNTPARRACRTKSKIPG